MSNEDLQLLRTLAEVIGLLGGAWVIAQRVGVKILKMVNATDRNTNAIMALSGKVDTYLLTQQAHASELALHNDRLARLEGAAGFGRTLNQGGPL